MRSLAIASWKYLGIALSVAAVFAPGVASAQDPSAAAAADVLFKQGRQLHDEKRYAEACPKFAESYRLDPATGSLLALASCHEAEGKLASAWAEYNEVAERAKRDGQQDRVEIARQRAAVLEPQLAKLVINVVPGAAASSLVIKRDAVVLGGGAIGVPLPVDKGEHVIEASAPGYRSFSRRITIADGATQVMTIPKLVEEQTAAIAPAPAAAEPKPAEPKPSEPARATPEKPREESGSALRPIGIVAIVGGAIAAAGGTVFGVQAIGKFDDSNANNHCVNDVCDAEGKRIRLDARDAGNTSTGLFVLSAVLVGGGITMFVLGGPKEPKVARLAPAVSPTQGRLVLEGAF